MLEPVPPGEDLHRQTQHLLPWYVSGKLDAAERNAVEAHLLECADCRQDLSAEQALSRRLKAAAHRLPRRLAALSAEVEESRTADPSWGEVVFRRPVPLGWALAAQAASLAILIPALALLLARPQPLYRALGAVPNTPSGDAIALFSPSTSMQSLSKLLADNGARIVNGPTSAGAYVLAVPPDRREAILARLRDSRDVSLAEPIDGDSRP
jgi:anti-sigma factor RsiW